MNTAASPSLTDLTAGEAAAQIAAGTLTSVDLVRALLERMAQTAGLNACISHDAQALLNAAGEADAARVTPGTRPLHGVPLLLKDNIDVAGVPSTAGSRAMSALVPQRDASVAQRLRDAGALVLGKANMHEFAYGITSNNAPYGAARNPYDTTRIPGGSSGGTAAAVAARAAPAGIGTDTGGSVRIPAALCGLVGFRPSTGRWPADGVVPISATLDTPGPMARSVADCVLLDGVVTGGATHLAAAELKGLRLGVPREYYWSPLEASLSAVAEDVLKRLEAAGVVLVPCEVKDVGPLTNNGTFPIALYETLPGLQAHHDRHGWPFDAAALTAQIDSPDVRGVFDSLLGANAMPESAYRHSMDTVRPQLQAALAECFASQRIAALIFPTTPRTAAPIGEDTTVDLCGEQVPTFPTFIRNTGPGALAGLPGISLPVGLTPQGLPVGMELDGPAGSDTRLLAIALALEAVLPRTPAPAL
ncbi:MAG: putative indoleacetamide hydrolase [Rhizobacter sp.]|nr:putative indoleacetamide hydrolase [Rhizobacter sp.]